MLDDAWNKIIRDIEDDDNAFMGKRESFIYLRIYCNIINKKNLNALIYLIAKAYPHSFISLEAVYIRLYNSLEVSSN